MGSKSKLHFWLSLPTPSKRHQLAAMWEKAAEWIYSWKGPTGGLKDNNLEPLPKNPKPPVTDKPVSKRHDIRRRRTV